MPALRVQIPQVIDAHETEAQNVTWTPPTATGDNCEAFGELLAAEEQSKPPKSRRAAGQAERSC